MISNFIIGFVFFLSKLEIEQNKNWFKKVRPFSGKGFLNKNLAQNKHVQTDFMVYNHHAKNSGGSMSKLSFFCVIVYLFNMTLNCDNVETILLYFFFSFSSIV